MSVLKCLHAAGKANVCNISVHVDTECPGYSHTSCSSPLSMTATSLAVVSDGSKWALSSSAVMWHLSYVGNRLRTAANECMASEPPIRGNQVPATQQTRQPAAAVAWHQHCSGCCHSQGGTEDHATCVWKSWAWAIFGQRAQQERCLCHLWPQRQRSDWGKSGTLPDAELLSTARGNTQQRRS